MLHHKLAKLKEKSGLTNQQIADKSGVPLSTVTRMFSGQTDNPTYRNVADIVLTLGGSLDEMEGIEHPEEKTPEKVIAMYEQNLAQKDKYIKILFTLVLVLIGVLAAAFILDLLLGSAGLIRY